MLQTALTVLLETGCGLYAAWSLMPQALRHALAGGFLRLRLPAALA
jgi:hypothetical protein